MTPPGFLIRDCVEADADTLVNLVRELAVYEKLESFANARPEDFRRHLFGPSRSAEAILANLDDAPVGFALFFTTFSTFRGASGLYLEDLFVRPDFRGRGYGKALLASVARRAVERGCGRLEWAVLKWNAPAIGFYQSVGAEPMDQWTTYRLHEAPLHELAANAPGVSEPTES